MTSKSSLRSSRSERETERDESLALVKLFRSIDANHDGSITATELLNWVLSSDSHDVDKGRLGQAVAAAIAQADRDKSGTVELDEFVLAFHALGAARDPETALRTRFIGSL